MTETDIVYRLSPALEIVRANAIEGDRTGAFVSEGMDALKATGFLRFSLGTHLGGDELSTVERVEAHVAIGRADLSAIWMLGNYDSHTWDLSGHAEEPFPGANELLRAETAFAGTVAPVPGSIVDGKEIVVNGRFAFSTGWRFASWMRCNVLLAGPDPATPGSESKFHVRLVHFPLDRPEVRVEPTWDADGLRATHTDTVVAEGLRVPYTWSMPYVLDPMRLAPAFVVPSPYYKEPGWALANSRAAVGLLGCGLELFDHALEYVSGGGRANQTGQPAARFPGVRYAMAEACIELNTALAAQRGVAADSDRRIATSTAWTANDEQTIWGMGMLSGRAALRAVDQIALALGGTGHQRALPFERLMRDIRTGASHIGIHPGLVRDRVSTHLFPGMR
jgi:alkylation response protein AidB-like acyl-CoA dehydrogenase